MGSNCQSCKMCRTESMNPKNLQSMDVYPVAVLEVDSELVEANKEEILQENLLNVENQKFEINYQNVIDYPDGSKYVGEVTQNEACGWGVLYYPNGNKFNGTWEHNKVNGSGVLLEQHGSKWAGTWQDQLLQGIGIEINDNYIYEGQYQLSQRHGTGKCVWNDQSEYAGEWQNDMMQGFGKYKFSDGSSYEGQWVENCMDGKGILNSNDGQVFEGDFKQDCKHGYGILSKKDGDCIEGFWKLNKIEGIAKVLNRKYSSDATLTHYQEGVEVKKYDESYINEIIPVEWVQPKQLVKRNIEQILEKIRNQLSGVEGLHSLVAQIEKQSLNA